ncbi:MAG: hypothetical protein J7524_04070 [Roseofilum sp. Belize BBD 4]|nr:hypothetical protein [Roseofilum sp. Belize Diploria]MBP0032330.1 hypothetical protein [Roseofilum sp. Belize BBD 4]HBQ97485.1 hypothetical protein [Cyanobacteria bacterium UBA11691]
MQETDPDRSLYLAISEDAFEEIFTESVGEVLLRKKRLNLIVFDEQQEIIVQWIP